MLYDFHNPLDVQNARTRLDYLIKRERVVELTEKKAQRTLNQNNYLHLILSYFACQIGETLDWVKKQYYKKTCNPDLYISEKEDKVLGKTVKYIRSSTELTIDEMTLSIERFRNWSSKEAGIYLPEATSKEELLALQIEVEKYKTYLY